MTGRLPTWELAPARWSDGLVLGDGRVGAVVWGDGDPLRITVDHTGAWDGTWSPPDPATHTFDRFLRALGGEVDAWGGEWPLLQGDHGRVEPSRLPPSRIELRWPGATWRGATLDLAGTATVVLDTSAGPVEVRVRVVDAVVRVEGDGSAPDVDVLTFRESGPPSFYDRRRLPAAVRRVLDDVTVARQPVVDRDDVVVGWRVGTGAAWSVAVAPGVGDADDALVARLASTGTTRAAGNQPWLTVPDQQLQDLWSFERYKLDAVTCRDGDPIGLQGPWSPDGIEPPWNGDLHFNVNVQMSYWPVATLGRFDLYEPLWRFVERALPSWRRFARDHFGVEGAFVPHATDVDGRALYNWAIPSFGLGNGAWLGHVLWQQWAYTGDVDVLRRLLPYLRELADVLVPLLEVGDDDRLHLPHSYAPELPTGDRPTWGPDATHDLSLLAWLLGALVDAGEVLGEDVASYDAVRSRLASPVADPGGGPLAGIEGTTGGLRVRADLRLDRSHRHHSHLMPVHPLRQVRVDGAGGDVVRESVRNLVFRGSGEWVGFSFAWAAAIAAAAGDGGLAWGWLRDYADRWLTAGSMNVQVPPRGSDATVWNDVAPFVAEWMTLEAGFGFMAALQDMLLQSHAGVLRLFPAVPSAWSYAAFAEFHAEGGLVVDATYRDGRVAHAHIRATHAIAVDVREPDGTTHAIRLAAGEAAELGDAVDAITEPFDPVPASRHLVGTRTTW